MSELGQCECGKYADYCEDCFERHEKSKSDLIDLLHGNGKNTRCIVIKCEHEVYNEEWAQILYLVNNLLQTYDNGKYANAGAFLEAV